MKKRKLVQLERNEVLALKCLNEKMRSCNNGKQAWTLGKKYIVKGKLVICVNGFHLTFNPEEWKGNRIFIAEASEIGTMQKDKFVCRSVKLVKELSKAELNSYDEAIAPAEKAYDEAIAPARKAYYEAMQVILKQLLNSSVGE